MLEVLDIKDASKIVPLEDEIKNMDPVTENMNMLKGKPVKAFQYQDHEAHIKTHLNFLQDPTIKQMVGQSPNASTIFGAIQAHIAEHIAYQYRVEIEKMMGVPLPPEDEDLPDDVEVELSRVVQLASDKLLQKSTAEAQAKKNQQAAQDPVVQMQQAEMQLKQAKFQHDKAMDEAELQLKTQEALAKDQRENKRIDTQAEIEAQRLQLIA